MRFRASTLILLTGLAFWGAGPVRADTILNAYGGPGGQSFISRCPPGQYMVGLTTRLGSAIDQVGPICARWSSGAKRFIGAEAGSTAGGPGGLPLERSCDAHFGVTELFVAENDDLVREITFNCDGEDGKKNFGFYCVKGFADWNPFGILFGNPCFAPIGETKKCPVGEMAVGVHGKAGHFVDSLGLICAPFDPAQSSPTPAIDIYFKPKLPNGLRLDACLSYAKNCGKPAADRYCQLRGRRNAKSFKLEEGPLGGFNAVANSSTTTMPIGDTRFCGASHCGGFHSITCECEPRPDESLRFDAPRVESTNRRLDWCNLWGGKDCGQKPADSFCISKGFARAADFALEAGVGRREPTQLFGQQVNEICNGVGCAGFGHITCEGAYLQTNCGTGLAAKSYTEPCLGGMVRGFDGLCRCPPGKKWQGSGCVPWIGPKVTPSPLGNPFKTTKEKFRVNNKFATAPFKITRCAPPRPVGSPPNCCPLGTVYSRRACRVIVDMPRPGKVYAPRPAPRSTKSIVVNPRGATSCDARCQCRRNGGYMRGTVCVRSSASRPSLAPKPQGGTQPRVGTNATACDARCQCRKRGGYMRGTACVGSSASRSSLAPKTKGGTQPRGGTNATACDARCQCRKRGGYMRGAACVR